MLLPVWAATWEFECCRPEATVGERWKAALFLHNRGPWWEEYADTVPPEERELGVAQLEAEVLRSAPDAQGAALLGVGDLRIGGVGFDMASGRHAFRGQLVFEGHVGPPGVELEEVETEGVVRRVRLVPLVRELRDGMWVPVRQEVSVDVHSTADRRDDGMPPHVTDDLLVDLEVGEAR